MPSQPWGHAVVSVSSSRDALVPLSRRGLFVCQVSPERFARLVGAAIRSRSQGGLTEYSVADYRRMRCFVGEEGRIGGAILDRGNGYRELVSVFNNGGRQGSGWHLVDALIAHGANYLECFRGYLSDRYAEVGFVEVWSTPWDPALAPNRWNPADGTPDVVCMALAQSPPAR